EVHPSACGGLLDGGEHRTVAPGIPEPDVADDLFVEPVRRDDREVSVGRRQGVLDRTGIEEPERVDDRRSGEAVRVAGYLACVQRHPQADLLFGGVRAVVRGEVLRQFLRYSSA